MAHPVYEVPSGQHGGYCAGPPTGGANDKCSTRQSTRYQVTLQKKLLPKSQKKTTTLDNPTPVARDADYVSCQLLTSSKRVRSPVHLSKAVLRYRNPSSNFVQNSQSRRMCSIYDKNAIVEFFVRSQSDSAVACDKRRPAPVHALFINTHCD